MPLLHEQVYDRIVRQIAQGERQPGDQLPTEQQYAAALGVSRITVKRAMSRLQRDGYVERYRGKGTFVTERARQLATRRQMAGQADSLDETDKSGLTRRIGFIIPEVSDLFGVEMLNGVDDRCRELGFELSFRRSHGSFEIEAHTISAWKEAGVDGIIIFPSHGEFYNQTLLRTVLDGFPVVLVDRWLSGIPVPSVMTDHYQAARAITERMFDDGHRRIAFASPGIGGTSSLEERMRGFQDAVHARDDSAIAPSPTLELDSALPGNSSHEAHERDRQKASAFFAAHPDVTACLASEYSLAILLDDALDERRDPTDPRTAIYCFDSPGEAVTSRRFPHIKQDEYGIGQRAVDLVVAQLDGPVEPKRHLVTFSLVTISP